MPSTYLELSYSTFEQLLTFLATFGHRYRIWYEDKALSPAALLAQVQHEPVFQQPCFIEKGCWKTGSVVQAMFGKTGSVEHALFARGSEAISGDRIWLSTDASGRIERYTPSPYFLEDLLALRTVMEWLQQLGPHCVIADLHRDAQLSTFLEHYYQDVLGYVPEQLATTRVPIWCVYLEGLLHGLNPNGHLERIEVPAEVVCAWLGEICAIFSSAQSGKERGLNDGEEVYQGL